MHPYVTVASVASLTAVLPPEARHEHRTYIARPRDSMALSQLEKTVSDDPVSGNQRSTVHDHGREQFRNHSHGRKLSGTHTHGGKQSRTHTHRRKQSRTQIETEAMSESLRRVQVQEDQVRRRRALRPVY